MMTDPQDPMIAPLHDGRKSKLDALAPFHQAPPHAKEEFSGVPLQTQTADLMTTLTDPETKITYKKAAQTSWILLKKAALLLAYLGVTGFALFVWICGIAFQGGHHFREWIEVKSPSFGEVVFVVLQVVAFPFARLYQWAIETVRKTLGLEFKFNSFKDEINTPESDEFGEAIST
jgi:hypothetical protein